VNLLRAGAAEGFRAAITEAYQARFGLRPDIYPCVPSAGAGEL